MTINLPDGYNGHTVPYFAIPIDVGECVVRLRCAVAGKEYMTRWVWRETWEKSCVVVVDELEKHLTPATDERNPAWDALTEHNPTKRLARTLRTTKLACGRWPCATRFR